MESILTPPSSFCFDKNASDANNIHDKWIKWKRSYEIYSKACEINKKSLEIQVNILLHVVGEQCREILDQLPEKCTTVENIWKKLDEQFKTKRNVTVERHRFFIRDQRDNETIEQYVFELGKLAQNCEFRDLHDELIKDRLVCGVSSAAIRERLLREDDLSLKKAMDICRAAVASRTYSEKIKPEREDMHNVHQVKQMQNHVALVKSKISSSRGQIRSQVPDDAAKFERWSGGRGDRAESRCQRAVGPRERPLPTRGRGASQWRSVAGSNNQCSYCGIVHKKFECPAYGQKCARCLRMNHFARVCGVNYIEDSDDKDSEASG
ncbi:uncharacterized protein LOC120632364 [Pararge aegeria]|uniref:uncharacterized protein LOC120631415 n=2 Tax=Pararge aegeria TaxID=116150 RepID=UPI0019D111A9|nr:uncharacterized protein LOC120631415 [Pararge aegeria]XP_039758083.1 uncharacterized protein LOC120632306 [Pararge aegeria]XP_039758154.1 uncharacterized protein LOC120632364 [Pararge aegeria]